MKADEIPVFDFQVSVCLECLMAVGQECHTPGCAFWLHDVPDPGTAHALRYARDLDAAGSPT